MTVTEAPEAWFPGEIVPPDEGAEAFSEGPPRDRPSHLARWTASTVGPGAKAPARPSERVEVATNTGRLTYELLGLPRQLRSGRRVIGVEATVMPVATLYPLTAALQEQGGEEVIPSVPVAVWDQGTDRNDRGQYFTYTAEAPAEFAADFMVKNRQLFMDGLGFRIIDPVVPFQVPRVLMTLRGPRK